MAQGRSERAARLFGAAEALRDVCGAFLTPDELADGNGWVEATRAALDKERFAAAWAEGRGMTREQAVCAALAEHEIPFRSPDRRC